MKRESVTVYLGLGGNVGDPVTSMAVALRSLGERDDVIVDAASRLYKTPPWGKTDQDWFFNACAVLTTKLEPEALLDLCLEIERSMKRVRMERWGPRTLDIDILAYDSIEMASERLTLPHPRMHERGFVLMPLADLAPDFTISGRSVQDWLEVTDKTGIEAVSNDRNWWRT
jgi:2-amino-4-hydroxy-6-hydroxymethyldihydropteridine diphosphokinase